MQPEEAKKRSLKNLVTFLIILVLFEIVIVWYMIQQFHENYLSGAEALAVTLDDLGLSEDAVRNTDIALRHKDGRAGVRNDIWIVPTVGCVNDLARRLAAHCGGIALAQHQDVVFWR